MQKVVPNIEEIFFAALELESTADRSTFLDRACGDAEVRRRVERLLAHDGQVGGFLESAASAPTVSRTPDDNPAGEELGTTIGPYKLLEQIGEGGMGTVYTAEQHAPVRRRVALKVIKAGMNSGQVIARFEAERQALAMMDHPCIARVLDGGTTDSGLPFFVMELVRGLPITVYCDREQLSLAERLELFTLVCRAVQHAHQKGIIHRDLKPSNILVTLIDGVAVPKVIDFGVAKATGGALTEKPLFTGFHQFIGTPLYTSPEQANLSGVDVDTRSDIYSLGVLLYELLTGTTPFDSETLKKAAFDEMRRMICEDEPPRPSTRLSTLGDNLSKVSACRKAEPKRLGAALKGELDWVVMKAMEKDRRRRYETANDFAADVMRYLTDQPVAACPPSASYRFAKFARRNRAAVVSAVLASAALIIGTTVASWQAARATAAQRQAEDHLAQGLQAVDELYAHVATQSSTELRWAPMPRVFLLKVLPFYERFAAARRVDPESGLAHRRIGEILMQLGRSEEARSALTRSEAIWRAMLAVDPDQPNSLLELARCLNDRGELPTEIEERIRILKEALEYRLKLVDRFPGDPLYPRELGSSYYTLARWSVWQRRPEAQEFLDRALKLRERISAESPNDPDALCDVCETLRQYAAFLSFANRFKESKPYVRRSYDLADRLLRDHPTNPRYFQEVVWDSFNLGATLSFSADPKEQAEAARLLDRAVTMLGGQMTDNPGQTSFFTLLFQAHSHRALLMSRIGDQAKLEESARVLVDHVDKWRDYSTMCHTAWSLCQSNIRAHAAPEVALKLARVAHRQAPDDSLRSFTLALALFRAGQWDEAIDAFVRTNELEKGTYLGFNGFFLAMAYHHKGDEPRARSWYERSVAWMAELKTTDEIVVELAHRYREEATKLMGIPVSAIEVTMPPPAPK